MMKLGIILGSTRPTRISPVLGTRIQGFLEESGLEVDIIDLVDVGLPFLNEAAMPSLHQYEAESTKRWSGIVTAFDGFVLLSPQYNWGYPAVLKNALDTLYVEWRGKPVSMVTYGGHGGFQAALALGLVVRGLHMRPLATNPQITISEQATDERGQLIDADALLEPYRPSFLALGKEFLSSGKD
ncbi:NADPH-dependent FMN reductase [Bifidobacterium psychraerophilum]|jgi:NAD(P)H-dependent FMN reductase|uniref:NADPH-dependent FMN reductase n=1 Tax=Bifidobacterium psychraerophilum TaxID=218140 RepID=UPI0023F3F49C|nr:NADPH-dependent FMN reductase [Bifidobacterium psychraerophilum]MCI1661139.1 NAD(P)H-dependent oxidoreductase [Bifidobacterium psychraerophilum]MCI1805106.1 NAD(P)H-dependent oxidoreductase [Bifidobacterium psychraerophilum]MCI2175567.1 NAD(P)H-dependent oxidoreductase [Bifidobacterium psychraerophilum]MCI2182061.1 NAD(P)H-dependent oxidoreductase [Bifidobacterium psychraerophilum]